MINPPLHECHPTLVCVIFINCSSHLQTVGLNFVTSEKQDNLWIFELTLTVKTVTI